MKFIPTFIALMLCAAAGAAQQPPTPPTPPARATRPVRPTPPAPAPRPSRVLHPGDPDYDLYYDRAMDAIDSKTFMKLDELRNLNLDFKNNFRFDQPLMSADLQDRLRDATVRGVEMAQRASEAAERGSMIGMRAADAAQRAVESARLGERFAESFAPLARIGADIAANVGANFSTAFAPQGGSLSPRWQQTWGQDRDPADSVFSSARDALNRGDWRRSADLFATVFSKYPKSTRVAAAAYYEAFSRYRIGTTDDLKTALRVLTERASSTPGNSYNNNEAASLATRIRGVLAQRGDPEAARQLQADAQKGKICDSEDMQVRSEALSALAQSDMVAATPMLRRVLEKKDPCTLELRRRALSILLRRADTAATSAAISVAKNADETIDLRTDAIQYLSRLPGDNALAALEDLMRTSNDRDVQRAAVRSLANTDNPKARQAIRALLERSDVSEQLRYEALSSFEHDRGGSAEDAAFLRGLYSKLQVERLKTQAIAAVSKTAGTENEQWVLSVARNTSESSEVRANAISRMYRMPAITISEISKLYDTADSRQMRDQIISVLSQRKEPEAIDKLGDIVKNGTDPSTRQRAISALGRKDDPRAKKMLQDLIDR
ncbi:MAG: HEAT repeat domain-containing protein [Gemmatimonadota bacterium]|nr:HEAT repeat domain-containing protein [Gemmatimonadota bacterium]